MSTNRKYKDSVFTRLFSEKSNLLELYNAIENTKYGKDTDIQITTLDDALFMERINDISFVIDGKIVVLIEHQSTVNQNMPLRMLMYIARTYEKITESGDIYRTSRIEIPKPEFIVLYNGKDEIPDRQMLKLSDMFANFGKTAPACLELAVKVYNINKGHNKAFARKSAALNGYETFIASVREYEGKTGSRDKAIELAVKDCIRKKVLDKFLKENSSEVRNMLLSEWNMEDALAVRYKEGVLAGEARGEARGEAHGMLRGRKEGMMRGRKEGIMRGREEGMMQLLALLRSGVSLEEAENRLSHGKPAKAKKR